MISSSIRNVLLKYCIYPNVREFFLIHHAQKLNVFCTGIFLKTEDSEQGVVIQAEYWSKYGKPKHCVSMSDVLQLICILFCNNQSQKKTRNNRSNNSTNCNTHPEFCSSRWQVLSYPTQGP